MSVELFIGFFSGISLGIAFSFYREKSRRQAEESRLTDAMERLKTLENAAAAQVRAESMLAQYQESSVREMEMFRKAEKEKAEAAVLSVQQQLTSRIESLDREHAAEIDALRREYEIKLTSQLKASSAELEAERRVFAAERDASAAARKTMEEKFRESQEQIAAVTNERTEHLRQEFKTLSETILKERTESLQSVNREQLKEILNPLKEKLSEYRAAIESAEKNGIKLNENLKNQYETMVRMTKQIGDDANHLALALKGQNKTQGDWGEMILETILRDSGLIKDVHYETQAALRTEDGELVRNEDHHFLRPDVIVHYPDGKDVLIDSKVSLTAFTDYVNSATPEEQKDALERHVRSVRAHVEELAAKNYPSFAKERATFDFVIMFIPNEPPHQAVMLAAPSLWREAFHKHVLIVSPVNLMALLQMIRVAWTHVEQGRNQKEIIDMASRLLDRVFNFYDTFNSVGDKLSDAVKHYEKAVQVLKGRQSIAGAAEKLMKFGVTAKKNRRIPSRFCRDELSETLLSDKDKGERKGFSETCQSKELSEELLLDSASPEDERESVL